MGRPSEFNDAIEERIRDASTYRAKDSTWCGPIRIKDLRSLRWALADTKQDNEMLRAVLTTPEVYVGVISEAFERHMGELIKERDAKIRDLELQVAKLAHLSPALEAWKGETEVLPGEK